MVSEIRRPSPEKTLRVLSAGAARQETSVRILRNTNVTRYSSTIRN